MIIYDLHNTPHVYTYVDGRDYEQLGDRFLSNTFMALDYLYRTNALTITYIDEGEKKTLDIIDVLVADVVNGINIVYSERKNYYRPSTNTVGFMTHTVLFLERIIVSDGFQKIRGTILLWLYLRTSLYTAIMNCLKQTIIKLENLILRFERKK